MKAKFENNEESDILLLGNVYIPAKTSIYSDIQQFTEIEQDILRLGSHHRYLLCGDFNSHTGARSDLTEMDKNVMEQAGMQTAVNTDFSVTDRLTHLGFPVARVSIDDSCDRYYGDRLLQCVGTPFWLQQMDVLHIRIKY